MAYVDGFVVPVPRDRLEDYRKLAELGAELWCEYGALEYREWVADDVQPGKLTSFPQSVMLQEDEVVVFAWITYPSREKRDEINQRVMHDPRMQMDMSNPPFDGKRMFWGGFTPLVTRDGG